MIALPDNVVCEIRRYLDRWVVAMTGPYGYLTSTFPASSEFYLTNKGIETDGNYTEKLLQKMIIASTAGFKRYLRIRGVGYHLKPLENSVVTLIAGFSYDVKCPLHPSIKLKATRKFSMIRTQSKYIGTITNNLALLRKTRKADIYRGLGVYYRYEKITYKPGSKQKSK